MTNHELNQLWDHQYHLYVSSHFFIIPLFLSIYSECHDVLLISTSVLVTTLLRWGHPDKEIYQYIDHNWVKIIYIFTWLTIFYYMIEKKTINLESVFLASFLLTILVLFIIEMFIWYGFKSHTYIPIHMLIHFYTIVLMIAFLFLDYDSNQTLKQCFSFSQKGAKYIASLVRGE